MTRFNPLNLDTAPKLVMFDLDGTLVDSVPDLHAAVNRMRKGLNMPSASIDQVKSWVGNGAAMLVKRALADDIKAGELESEEQFEAAYQTFLASYEEHNGEKAELYEGAKSLFEALKAQALNIAIITNKPEQFTLPLLDKLGLTADIVLSGDSLPEKKPHPAPLLHCLAHFNVATQEALMIGDSVSDISAANQASVPSIAVSYGYNHGQDASTLEADRLIHSLNELIPSALGEE